MLVTFDLFSALIDSRTGGSAVLGRLAAAARTGAQVVVPKPGERIDALAPPAPVDWWTAVGSAAAPAHADAGVGSSVLARTLTKLLSLLPG